MLLLVPIIGILLAYFGIPYTTRLPDEIIEIMPYAPYLIFVGALLLGGFFKRHRIAIIGMTMGLCYLVIHNAVSNAVELDRNIIFALIGTLLPINIALLSNIKEQQVLSVHGFLASSIILVQFVIAYWVLQNYQTYLETYLLFHKE